MLIPCTLRLGHPEPGAFTGSLPLEGIPPPTRPAPPNQVIEWSEEEVVYLHWRLLQDVAQLADAAALLAEKFDTLRWVFSDPHYDPLPFSFANCQAGTLRRSRWAGCPAHIRPMDVTAPHH